MKPETRVLLQASAELLAMGIKRALSQLQAEEAKAASGRPVDEATWRYYYDLGTKTFRDIAKLAGLELRDEAAEERKAVREAEPVTADEALRVLKAEMAGMQAELAALQRSPLPEAAPPQPTGVTAKADAHAPKNSAPVPPPMNFADLRDAWASSSQWLIDARGGQKNPITHKVRKVLAPLGIVEGEPMATVMRFRELAGAMLGIEAKV